jgi:Tfp pilus assembly protein PilN
VRAINLLPPEQRAGRRSRPPAAPLAIAGVAVLLAVGLTAAFVSASGKVDERERELAAVEREVAASRRAVKAKRSKPSRPRLAAQRNQRLTAVNDVLGKRLAWDRVLRDVSLVIPDDVWFTNLKAGEAGAAGAAPTSETTTPETTTPSAITVTFTGFTYSQESVARLLTRLRLAPELTKVRLQQSSATEVGRQKVFGFTVLADVETPGGTS